MRLTRKPGNGTIALVVVAVLALATAARGSSIEEDDEDVSGADRVFGPPESMLVASRQRAAATGFGGVAGVSAYAGSDGNVFRSPSSLAQQSDAWGNSGYLRSDLRWRRTNRMLTTLTWAQTRFQSFDQIDSTHPHLSNWFEHRLGPTTSIELDVDVVHQNDDATTITGFAYTRDYSYWRYGGEAVFEWEPTARHRFRLSAERVRKDYGEVSAFNSLDWSQWRAGGSYRFRFGPRHVAGVRMQFGERTYVEEPASIADGTELAGNPAEHHRYEDLTLWYDLALGARADLDVRAIFGGKTDLFAGYEDYRDRGLRLSFYMQPSAGSEIRAGLVATHRDYTHLAADGGARLAYETVEARLGARIRVLGAWWVFGDLNTFRRDTNRSSGLDYRDYQGVFTRAGVSVFL